MKTSRFAKLNITFTLPPVIYKIPATILRLTQHLSFAILNDGFPSDSNR